ncbi:MAG: pyruvate, phosphate dikinase [Oscillospiraceae bacterium]|jgi:pyruvate,orthophosphate dikinase|nr:pyruvate, phosphate dikinase [Oscillospiraceae bacterium]
MKYVYLFSEGTGKMRELLGGKGANLAEMTNLGLPVPQGFTVSTEACTRYYEDGESINAEITAQIEEYLKKLEGITGKKFGDAANPLLVSVRSGSRASMPGMMDTILNLGLNDEVTEGLATLTNNPRFAYDSHRRFIQMFSDVVMELPKSRFEVIIDEMKKEKGVRLDVELDADDMKALVQRFKAFYKEQKGASFPEDPRAQLIEAVKAVFRSWNNPRAVTYRRMNDISSSWGTAVNVQSMVFGNMGEDSGTGVAFTRNPATGERKLYGEFLMNAQGEDVVAGIRTPQGIDRLASVMPEVYGQFTKIADTLEKHYRDMQDMEFTIEKGKLYMLQTRSGKRTAAAALKIAVDLVSEGMRTKEEAVLMVEPKQLDALLHPQFEPAALNAAQALTSGLPASPGAACGAICFTAEEAKALSKSGPVLLVRQETSPEDIEGMAAAQGILTARGGMTSHAAVVARGMGTCCVAGCSEISVSEAGKTLTCNGKVLKQGDFMSIDGSTGKVYVGKLPTIEAQISGDFDVFMGWADELRTLKIRTNADTPADAAKAVEFGAEGIGLCRTEHMFFEADRIMPFREMIASETTEQRKKALEKIEDMQRADFEGIFAAMDGLPVTIRFLDPPLHEFLPQDEDGMKELAGAMGFTLERMRSIVNSLHEINPMLGNRGVRLAVMYPEIAEMQTRAVINGAINAQRKGVKVLPEIMIPLVCEAKELKLVKDIVVSTAEAVMAAEGVKIDYLVGTMIEVPRAALTADEIAKEAEFFSFGTNDLTQMAYALSRDDAGPVLETYFAAKIFESDPTARFDRAGTGKLVKMAVELGRAARPDIKLGVCGEHGGDPSSIEFFHGVGLAYVSCSPFRVPIARLAAAQAAVKSKE